MAEESDSDHGDFDPTALREHEEFTKVWQHATLQLCAMREHKVFTKR